LDFLFGLLDFLLLLWLLAQHNLLVACDLLVFFVLLVLLFVELLVFGLHKDLVGIVECVLEVFGLLDIFDEQALQFIDWSQPLEFSDRDLGESFDKIVESYFLHVLID
jgi:hypothetical protein